MSKFSIYFPNCYTHPEKIRLEKARLKDRPARPGIIYSRAWF